MSQEDPLYIFPIFIFLLTLVSLLFSDLKTTKKSMVFYIGFSSVIGFVSQYLIVSILVYWVTSSVFSIFQNITLKKIASYRLELSEGNANYKLLFWVNKPSHSKTKEMDSIVKTLYIKGHSFCPFLFYSKSCRIIIVNHEIIYELIKWRNLIVLFFGSGLVCLSNFNSSHSLYCNWRVVA